MNCFTKLKLTIPLFFFSCALLAQTPSFLNRSIDWKTSLDYNEVKAPSSNRLEAIKVHPLNHAISVHLNLNPIDFLNDTKRITEANYTYCYIGYSSEDAVSLALRLREVYLPEGASLFIINPESNEFKGPYSGEELNASKALFTGFIKGDKLLIELRCPTLVLEQLTIKLEGLDYGFIEESVPSTSALLGFGDALECELNVNCPENILWQNTKKSVCRITVVTDQGAYWCSGTLMNNTNEDKHPYILTAKHCYFNDNPQYDLWTFDFGYESVNCENPTMAPSFNTIFGSSLVAEREDSDFLLLELNNAVPDSYDVVYAGWNRDGIPADSSALIGHPLGDIKKISMDYDIAEIYSSALDFSIFVIPPDHLYELEFDLGIFEPGSSGGPMLDQNSRVVGQLTGGFANDCNSLITYYGRFSRSWNDGSGSNERLKDWLDPAGLNPLFLDELSPAGESLEIGGKVLFNGLATVGVDVMLDGELMESVSSDDQGDFLFVDLISGGDYSLSFSKNNLLLNGVTTLDAVFIQKHILAIDPFLDPYKLISADLNASGSVTTLDIVHMQKAILGLSTNFPNNESWRFVAADYVFSDPTNPFLDNWPETLEYTNLSSSQDGQNVIAIKIGDINGNANPAF